MLRQIVFSLAVALPTVAYSAQHDTISSATSFKEFNEQFCSAKRDAQRIFVVPIAVFKEQSVKCADGESKLQATEAKDDPGHMLFTIIPPSGSKDSFDCDGKADINITVVALNCLPVSQEAATHTKQ